MAKIFAPPESITPPNWDTKKSHKDNMAAEATYIENLAAYCKEIKPGNDKVGKTIRFPVADGYAVYMVAGLRPIELIHIPIGDAWEYEYAHRLTMSDILEKIQKQEALNKLFSKK